MFYILMVELSWKRNIRSILIAFKITLLVKYDIHLVGLCNENFNYKNRYLISFEIYGFFCF